MDAVKEKSTLSVMGPEGDVKIEWDKNREDEVDAARAAFDKWIKKGYFAYKVSRFGRRTEQIREFDPDAERIALVPQIAGG